MYLPKAHEENSIATMHALIRACPLGCIVTHERSQQLPWKVSDAPQDYLDRLLEMIVGIEVPIEKLIGKWKASQNRSDSDRAGVAAGLAARPDGLALTDLVKPVPAGR